MKLTFTFWAFLAASAAAVHAADGLAASTNQASTPNTVAFDQAIEEKLKIWKASDETVPVDLLDLDRALTNITSTVSLTPLQKSQLIKSIKGFYRCYTQSSFEGFKEYRLGSPYEINTNTINILLNVFAPEYKRVGDTAEDLKAAWYHYAATNVISRVDPSSIKVTVEMLNDKTKGLIIKARSQFTNVNAAVLVFPQAVITHPTAHEIFDKDHVGILHATVEQFVKQLATILR